MLQSIPAVNLRTRGKGGKLLESSAMGKPSFQGCIRLDGLGGKFHRFVAETPLSNRILGGFSSMHGFEMVKCRFDILAQGIRKYDATHHSNSGIP